MVVGKETALHSRFHKEAGPESGTAEMCLLTTNVRPVDSKQASGRHGRNGDDIGRGVLMKKWLLYTVASGCLLSTACHHNPRQGKDPASEVVFNQPVTLEVANHNWSDVTVYVVYGSQRTRLTTVTATQEAAVTLPAHALRPSGEIRLLAHAVGNPNTFLSEVIVAKSGMTIAWTLETDLHRSSLAVW